MNWVDFSEALLNVVTAISIVVGLIHLKKTFF